MSPQPPKLLRFHAGGHAFSANFTRPVACQVQAAAAAFLPTIGGYGYARVDNFDMPRLVRFKSAQTHTSGSFQDEETATAQVTTTIEGLNILDMITADRITARLTSEHKVGDIEGHILAIGSEFENLRIGGHRFKVILRHELLIKSKTHAQLVKAVASDRKNGKMMATQGGVTVCSLLDEFETDFPGLSAADKKRHVITIPHFGTIALAEIVCREGQKTLTMLRFDLGSPDGGEGSAGEADLNGPQYPPPH